MTKHQLLECPVFFSDSRCRIKVCFQPYKAICYLQANLTVGLSDLTRQSVYIYLLITHLLAIYYARQLWRQTETNQQWELTVRRSLLFLSQCALRRLQLQNKHANLWRCFCYKTMFKVK